MPKGYRGPLVDCAYTCRFYKRFQATYDDEIPRIAWLMKEDDEYYYVEALNALGNPDIRPPTEKLSKNEWTTNPDDIRKILADLSLEGD